MHHVSDGHAQLLSILEDISTGKAKMEDLELLQQLSEDIKMGSLCGLGRSAPNPVLTTIRYFGDEYRAHILEKRCPALVCRILSPIISFLINAIGLVNIVFLYAQQKQSKAKKGK